MAVAQGISKQLKIGKQTALGGSVSGSADRFRRVTSTFNLERDTYSSNEIASHQQSTGATAGVGKTTGALNGELSAGTYSKLFAGLLRKDFAATAAMTGLTVTIVATGSPSGSSATVARSTGNWYTDGLKVGDIIRLSGGTLNAANSGKNLLVTGFNSNLICTVVPLNGAVLVNDPSVASVTATVVGKKSWVPTSGHTNDYFKVEEWYADLSRSEVYNDVKVAQAQLSLPATGIATVNFDMPGLSRTRGSSEVLTSPTAETTTSVLTAVQGKVLVGGNVTSITSAQVTITGNIQAGEAEVGSNSIADHQRGRVAVSGSFTAKFSSVALQDIFDDQTSTSLILVVADSAAPTADFVTLVMTNVKLFSDSADDGEKEIIRTYNFTAAMNGAGDATGVSPNTTGFHRTIVSIQDSQAA